MKRRQFIAVSLAPLLPGAARAQSKPRVVGLLWNDSVKPSPHLAILLGALRDLGWTSGRNLEIEDRVALEGYAPMRQSAAALVKRRCDVIATYGTTATLTVAKATREIPIAMLMGTDPVRLGLAASLSKPGSNVTGVTNLSQGLIGKRLELLRELVVGVKDVGVLSPGDANQEALAQSLAVTDSAAKALKLTLHVDRVRTPEEIDAAVARFAKMGIRALYAAQSTFLAAHSERVVRAVNSHRLVAVYPLDRFANAGGLLAYAPATSKAFVRLASYVDRLLRGAKPADTPIEQMSDVEMVINLKTARAQGVKIPQTVLQRANRLID